MASYSSLADWQRLKAYEDPARAQATIQTLLIAHNSAAAKSQRLEGHEDPAISPAKS